MNLMKYEYWVGYDALVHALYQATSECERLKRVIENTEAEVDEATGETDRAMSEISSLQEQVDGLVSDNRALQSMLDSAHDLNSEYSRKNAKLTDQNERLKRLLFEDGISYEEDIDE